jgi:mono/diheme cytochrome c family protein
MATKDSTWHVRVVKVASLLAIAIVVAAGSLTGCEQGAGSAAGASTDGAKIYHSLCAMCHGPNGTPDASMKARLDVRDLAAAEFRARVTPALVEGQVRSGSKNKLMPSFAGALNEDQIKAVAAYVASAEFAKK